MRVTCMVAAVLSRTCCSQGRARLRFCAARLRTDASRASSSLRAPARQCSSAKTWPMLRISSRATRCRATGSPDALSSPTARCDLSARQWPCALLLPARRRRISASRSSSRLRSCPCWSMRMPRGRIIVCASTKNGPTTTFSRSTWTAALRPRARTRRSWSRARSRCRGRPWCRWKARPCLPIGTSEATSSWSTPRPRFLTSSASASRSFSGSRRGRYGWCRPTWAGGLATNACCSPKNYALPGSR